ncbi:hypothetical protein ABBQ38_001411 [Trebouxia sp. C0009 RCD-2024]
MSSAVWSQGRAHPSTRRSSIIVRVLSATQLGKQHSSLCQQNTHLWQKAMICTPMSQLFVCRPKGGELCLQVLDPISSCHTEFWENAATSSDYRPDDTVEAGPWFSNLLKSAAEGCGFRASVKRVRTKFNPSYCTCLTISLDIPGATVPVV